MYYLDSIIVNLVSALIGAIAATIYKSRKYLTLFAKSFLYFNKDIRFSISYLYRIKIDDEYLLIKGNRIDQFQPIGGVYKYYSSFLSIKNDYEIRSESQNNFCEGEDLRFIVKGKYIIPILNWFNSKKNREVTIHREFYEELIRDNILNIEAIVRSEFEFIRQIEPMLQYSEHFNKMEILLFDIYELRLNNYDINQIRQSLSNDRLILVDMDSIKREHISINGRDCKIGAHAKYIL